MSLEKLKKISKIAAKVGVISLVGISLVGCGVTTEDVDNVLKEQTGLDSVELAQKLTDLEDLNKQIKLGLDLSVAEKEALIQEKATLQASLESKQEELTAKDLEIQKFNEEIVAEAEAEIVAEEEAKLNGYELDELKIGEPVEKDLTDKHVSKLVDGEVKFDGDDYEVEEYLSLNGLQLSVNGKDFGSDVFLTAEEGTVKYGVKLDSDLNVSKIKEEETLKLSLLGNEVEVVEWTEDKVTLIQGEESRLLLGEVITLEVNGATYEVQLAFVDDDRAKFIVNGESTGKLAKDDPYELADGSEIAVVDIDYQAFPGGIQGADFKLGSDLKVVIEDSEEYEEDSMWSWYVGDNEIGLVLSEELTYLDEDEDFQAVAYGESICLPEDYVCVVFAGMDEVDVAEYNFDVYEKENEDYLRVKGDFTFDMEDYGKVYVNAEGIFDKDLEVIGNCLEMDDTEFQLCLVNGQVVLESEDEDILLELYLADISVTVVGSVESEDEDYRTAYGVVLSNPEEAVDDRELKVTIPEEELLGTVSIK